MRQKELYVNGVLFSSVEIIIASMQVIEALKIIANFSATLDGRLLSLISVSEMDYLKLKKNPEVQCVK